MNEIQEKENGIQRKLYSTLDVCPLDLVSSELSLSLYARNNLHIGNGNKTQNIDNIFDKYHYYGIQFLNNETTSFVGV